MTEVDSVYEWSSSKTSGRELDMNGRRVRELRKEARDRYVVEKIDEKVMPFKRYFRLVKRAYNQCGTSE